MSRKPLTPLMRPLVLPLSLRHTVAIALIGGLAAAALPSCDQGGQGDRCNPYLYEDAAASSPNGAAYNASECSSGLTCTIPPTCVIAVCCPTSPPYTDPNCECLANPGAACACSVPYLLPDGGEDAGSIDSGSDSAASDSGGGTVDSGSDSATATDGASPLKDATAE
ncbi:MAG: hypothetical protein ACLQVI_42390 [Polyangiaceae bacterium]|jgi:hypothetical protein